MGRVIPARFAGWSIRALRGALSSGFPKAYTVLSFGDCSQGALGQSQGFLGDAFEPARVEGLPEDVIRIAAGHYHSLAVTSNGELWAWGRNNESQLGRGTTHTREQWSHPQKVQGLEGVKVKSAAGSGVVSMAIDVHGSLWAWGKSKRGQLGLGEGITEAPFPQLIQALAGQQIVQVSLGWGHALACTLKGNLYSWGYSADGRLGSTKGIECHGTPKTSMTQSTMNQAEKLELASKQTEEDMKREAELVFRWEPHLVDLDGLRAIGVACGFDHSMVVCENGLLLSFGDNSYGQLGRTARITDSAKEWRVCLSEHVASISAGLGHSLAVAPCCTHDVGQNLGPSAYSWGWNSAFQLGRTTVSSKPMQVLGLAEGHVLSLDGGRVHSLAVNYEGELWTWGSGRNGRLGLGSSADEQQPCLVESIQDLKVQQAVCGMDHTIILVTKR